MYAGPVIDAHTHPLLYPEGQIGEPHPPEDYRRRAAGSPVTRAAALVIAPRGDLAQTRRRNDATLGLTHDSEGFFYPVCSVHPSDGEEALAEVERVATAGCQWLKLHPNNQRFDGRPRGGRRRAPRNRGRVTGPVRCLRAVGRAPTGQVCPAGAGGARGPADPRARPRPVVSAAAHL